MATHSFEPFDVESQPSNNYGSILPARPNPEQNHCTNGRTWRKNLLLLVVIVGITVAVGLYTQNNKSAKSNEMRLLQRMKTLDESDAHTQHEPLTFDKRLNDDGWRDGRRARRRGRRCDFTCPGRVPRRCCRKYCRRHPRRRQRRKCMRQCLKGKIFITASPTKAPSSSPSVSPTKPPSNSPTNFPTNSPTNFPTKQPSTTPTKSPSKHPSASPTKSPSKSPSETPSKSPSKTPSKSPSKNPTKYPSASPTKLPTSNPTKNPSVSPTLNPTSSPSKNPSASPTKNPTGSPISPTACPTYHVNPINIDLNTSPCGNANAQCVQTNFNPSASNPFVSAESGWVFKDNSGFYCHKFVLSANCPNPELSVERFELDNDYQSSEKAVISIEESGGSCPQLAECYPQQSFALGQCGGYWENCLNSTALNIASGATTIKLIVKSNRGTGICNEKFCGFTYYNYFRFNLICRGLVSGTPSSFPPPLSCRNDNPLNPKNAVVNTDVSKTVELFNAAPASTLAVEGHPSWCNEVFVQGSQSANFRLFRWNLATRRSWPGQYYVFSGRTDTDPIYSASCPITACTNNAFVECGSVNVSAGIYRITYGRYITPFTSSSCSTNIDIGGTSTSVIEYNKIVIST